jgi:hypothetical protein
VTDLDPQKWTFSVKKPVVKKLFCLKKKLKKPVSNLPAGFFNKPWGLQALLEIQVADITCFSDCS